MTTTCPDCDEELTQTPDAQFCPHCGASLSEGDNDDWLQSVREEREGVEELGERDDRIGATARVLLAFADDKEPTEDDLADAGLLGPYYKIKEAYR